LGRRGLAFGTPRDLAIAPDALHAANNERAAPVLVVCAEDKTQER
jgi:hypothetical protein